MKHDQLISLTERLLEYTDIISKKFTEVKERKAKGDFFKEVKPFADEVKILNDRWYEQAKAWVETNKPRNLYPKQLESTYEQIEMLSIQCFFPDTSQTRFLNYLHTVRFILTTFLNLLKN